MSVPVKRIKIGQYLTEYEAVKLCSYEPPCVKQNKA